MSSSVGHALAGLATAWTADLVPGNRTGRTAPAGASWYRRAGDGLTFVCLVLGALPDIDLVWHGHRGFTHSLTSAVVTGVIAAAIASLTRRPAARVGLMCGCAYATHLLLDWLAVDRLPPRGIQFFWPFTPRYFISGWDVFLQTERRHFFSMATIETNTRTVALEIAILLPIVVVVWILRERALREASRDAPLA